MVPIGKAKRIAQLLREHAATLELYASQWTRAPEDCVQEAFVQLSRQSAMPDNPLAWLYRVVRNRALNQHRAARRRENHEEIAARLAARKPQHDASERLALVEALQDLDANSRELVILRIWSGLTWSEIADLTNTSSSGVHRSYVAALQAMKHYLDPTCLKNSN